MPAIELTPLEMQLAAMVGVSRRLASRDLIDKIPAKIPRWQIDITGAQAEMALAKYLGVYWSPTIGTFKAPDVGEIQVRSTEYEGGVLIIRPNDPPGYYALVITLGQQFKIPGYIHTDAARQAVFLDQPDPARPACWCVPQAALTEFSYERPSSLRAISKSPGGTIPALPSD